MEVVVPAGEPLAHQLLCAVPQLTDPNFRRAVVFMLDHDERGALGLVVNHVSDSSVGGVADTLGLQWQGSASERVRVGGPVEPARGWILHDDGGWDPRAQEVIDGLWLTTSLEGVLEAGHTVTGGALKHMLFMLGYASWAPGQLEAEISAGGWVVVPAVGEGGMSARWLLQTPAEHMWGQAMAMGGVDPARITGIHWGKINRA